MRETAVAIVGLPNVGKSTLFNRLLGRRRVLVGKTPGVTRDRVAVETELGERRVTLVDTGGIYADAAGGLMAEVLLQARVAVETAAVVLLVVSVREGLTPADRELARLLRTSGRPILLVVNKVDHPDLDAAAAEFFSLGFDAPLYVSAEHGLGIEALEERVAAMLPDAEPAAEPEGLPPLALALVGRPNVGKSSLLNRLLDEERAIVSSQPGTTRDSVDRLLEVDGRRYLLVDTAGIRRTGRRAGPLEQGSTRLALDSLRRSDVTLLLLDGSEGVTAQDLTVAGAAQRSRRPLVILINKWDTRQNVPGAREAFQAEIDKRFRFARYAPARFISALTGLGVHRIFPTVEQVWENGGIWIRSSRLNRLLQDVEVPGRTRDGQRIKGFYITQVGVHPPTFHVFTNARGPVHFSYKRHVENRLRAEFGFDKTPLILHWKRK